MRYLKYITGIQLLLGAIWCFYYSIEWAGFLLLALSSFILIPVIHKLLKKKLGGFKSGCLIFLLIIGGLSGFGINHLLYLLAPVDTNTTSTTNNDGVAVYAFEQNLTNATMPCFGSYDKAFSKSIKYQEEQCSLINEAVNACTNAQQEIDNITTQNCSTKETAALLNDIKTDAKNSVQGWANFFSMYNNQCINKGAAMNAADAKLQMVSAVKNMYLMNMKIKKAKSIS